MMLQRIPACVWLLFIYFLASIELPAEHICPGVWLLVHSIGKHCGTFYMILGCSSKAQIEDKPAGNEGCTVISNLKLEKRT
jgi:hypothetical protein